MSKVGGIRRYLVQTAVSLGLVAAAGALRLWPLDDLGVRLAYITLYPAVVIATTQGRLFSGVLCTALSALLVLFWQPGGQAFIQDGADRLGLVVFCINGLLISGLGEAMHRARMRAAEQAQIAGLAARSAREASDQARQALEQLSASKTELDAAHARLRALDEAKTAFYANVSHEFRTPLTLILGYCEDMLARESDMVALPRGQAIALRRNALRLLKLVDSLLEFARIEAGKVAPQAVSVDAPALTSQLASSFASVCGLAGVELVVDCPALPGPVLLDPQLWETVVLNLISNALKFTAHGRISVRLRQEAGELVLAVQDTGTGISPEDLPHVFDRFYQAKGAHQGTIEGSGIGLSLVKELVGLQGGRIEVQSVPGQGSSFTIRLPAAPTAAPQTAEPVDATWTSRAARLVAEASQCLPAPDGGLPAGVDAEDHAAWTGTGARLLVVDDNADMRAYLGSLLRRSGYVVLPAADGAAALELCRDSPPDLVLSDVMMPGVDGFELLRRLRADPETAALPVVLLSARAGQEARVEGLKRGADDYVVKPFTARELIARVDGVLRMAQLRRGAARHEVALMAQANARLQQEIEARTRVEAELTTHRQHLEELVARRTQELTAAKDAAEASSRAKSAFLANISHEIRTPLNAILGMTYLVRQSGVSQEQMDRLRKVEAAGEHLLQVIRDVLNMARIEAGKVELAQDPVEPAVIADAVLDMLHDSIAAKGLRTELDVQACAGPLQGDAAKIKQCLLNLAGNAVKFTASGTIVLRVHVVEEDEAGALVRFEVEDTGIGIAPDVMRRMFQPFSQADASFTRRYGGAGLGLAITHSLARAMGGEAGVDSVPGHGSRFWFTVRLRRAAASGEAATVAAPAAAPSGALAGRVLIVEDDPVNREIATAMLRGFGLTVAAVDNGHDAVALATRQPWDLILMDLQMPGMDGIAATREIRRRVPQAPIAIVAYTASAFDFDRQACADVGIDDFVTKPVAPDRLLQVLRRHLPPP